jgi:pyruvate formate lyase activating enzyme
MAGAHDSGGRGVRAADQPADLEISGLVSSIRRMAVHDDPGIRTVVFLKGCPLCCAWCAAPETQSSGRDLVHYPERCIACDQCRSVCTEEAIRVDAEGGRLLDRGRCTLCGECVEVCYAEALTMPGLRRTVAEVVAECVRDRAFYARSGGGVTISGGEPLQQAEFTTGLLAACKREKVHTALETSGFQRWEIFERLLGGLDLLLYDLKVMDPERHLRLVGVSNELTLENLRRALEHGVPTIIRVPVVAGHTDDDENCRAMAKFLRGLPAIQRIDLLPYHRLGENTYARLGRTYALSGIPPVSDERLAGLAAILLDAGFAVQIRG